MKRFPLGRLFVFVVIVSSFVVLFSFLEGAVAETLDLEYPFNEEFFHSVSELRMMDMYVFSPELNPSIVYKIVIDSKGIHFWNVGKKMPIEEPVLKEYESGLGLDIEVEEELNLKAASWRCSYAAYLKGPAGISLKYMKLTSKTDLFCVVNCSSSLVVAFRVLFNQEPRPAKTDRLPGSSVILSGTLSGDLSASVMRVQGVRWLQIAINPKVAYEMLRPVFE